MGVGDEDRSADHDRPLILDEFAERLAQFRVLRDHDDAATDRLLDELGAQGRVEHEIVGELAAPRPLAHPERFAEAHVGAMHALEVLSRNGSRAPSQLRLGLLTPVARAAVQQMITLIVRSHQTHVANSLRDLYVRRLGWVPADDPARMTLVRARLDVERALPTYKKKGGGIPTFLVGGAAASSLAQVATSAAGAAAGSRAGVTVAVVTTVLVLAVASWVILQGAAVARRRIRLTLDRPLAALWETIGWCGSPPEDSARTFALVAIALTLVGVVVIPVGILVVVAGF